MSSEAPIEHSSRTQILEFGQFRLIPRRRLLLSGDAEVRIGGRALDILLALIERAGQLVTKEELIARVWPNSVVEEINLRVHIAGLRRALGDGREGGRYIVNTVGRGYCFVAPVDRRADEPTVGIRSSTLTPRVSLPAPLTRMFGRKPELDMLNEQISTRRLTTVVGPAGVGKSTLALAAAHESAPRFEHGVYYLDLAMLTEPSRVIPAIAAAFEQNSWPELAVFLHDKRLLLVLDHCERVIASAASACEGLLKSAPRLHMLVASRAPLGSEAECQHALHPLDVPHESADQTADSIRCYAAVELFIERAAATVSTFALNDANAVFISHICRRCDGIPLTMELAAARVNLFSVREIASRLDAHILGFTNGRRTAAARHHTMRAALDCSLELLSRSEQVLLQRLAVFQGAFTLESAIEFAGRRELDRQTVCEGLLSLAEKSLIVTDIEGCHVRHRLLNTTRAYALEKLMASVDRLEVFRWHAEEVCRVLRGAALERTCRSPSQDLENFAYLRHDARAALQWALSAHGDASIAAKIAAVAMPLLTQTATADEIAEWVERAMRRVADLPGSSSAQACQPPC